VQFLELLLRTAFDNCMTQRQHP